MTRISKILLAGAVALAVVTVTAPAKAEMVRCRTSPSGWCYVSPAPGPVYGPMYRQQRVVGAGVGVGVGFGVGAGYVAQGAPVVVEEDGYRARKHGHRKTICKNPETTLINNQCRYPEEVAEQYSLSRAAVCGNRRGPKEYQLPDGRWGHFSC